MNHNTLGPLGGWALVLLAATQGLLLGLRPWPGSVASDPWLTAGDRLPYQEVHDALGQGVRAPSPALTRRTPWVFVLDEGGRVVAEGHGACVADLVATQSLRGLASGASAIASALYRMQWGWKVG